MPDRTYARWKHALAGNKLDLGVRGDPPAGYYRKSIGPAKDNPGVPRWEAFAVFPDGDGLKLVRSIFTPAELTDLGLIDEYFAGDVYPVPYVVYQAVAERGEPWPEIYTTRIPTSQLQRGVFWSEQWAREHLALKAATTVKRTAPVDVARKEIEDGARPKEGRFRLPESASLPDGAEIEVQNGESGETVIEPNPRATMGHNEPPASETLSASLDALVAEYMAYLEKIEGGVPKTQAEADQIANYAERFQTIRQTALGHYDVEKAPHEEALKKVRELWFPLRDKAINARKAALDLTDIFIAAEKKRRAEEAKAAEDAKKKAEAAARAANPTKAPDPTPAPRPRAPDPIRVGSTGRRVSQREVTSWIVEDPKAFGAYLLAMPQVPPDLIEVMTKIAGRQKLANVSPVPPGIKVETTTRSH